jgi:hypothetical protein
MGMIMMFRLGIMDECLRSGLVRRQEMKDELDRMRQEVGEWEVGAGRGGVYG